MKQKDQKVTAPPRSPGRPPMSVGEHPMLQLQRLAGNRAVTSLVQGSGSLPVQRLRRLPDYQQMLELRRRLSGADTVSGLSVEKQARQEIGSIGQSLKGGYQAGRHGVHVKRTNPATGAEERGGLGMLLGGMGRSAVKNPGQMLKRSHRMAGFFGAMGLGLTGRAAAYVPEKISEWRRAGEPNAVNFGPDEDEEAEPGAGETVEDHDETAEDEEEEGGAVHF